MIREIALWGIALNLCGVLGLFYFGMPFKLPTGGAFLLGTEPSAQALMLERLYGVLGTIALLLTIGGSALQGYAAWLSP